MTQSLPTNLPGPSGTSRAPNMMDSSLSRLRLPAQRLDLILTITICATQRARRSASYAAAYSIWDKPKPSVEGAWRAMLSQVL